MFSPGFFVMAFIAIASASDIECPDVGQQFFPHPTTCNKFLECNNGRIVEQQCFGNFIFNPELGFCDFPENVDCADAPEELKPGPVGTCPEKNGQYVHFLTDATDCSVFYMCNWGNPIRMNCPDGLHFNPKINVCDYPNNAGCTAGQ